MKTCSVDGCEGRSKGHGYCIVHYTRWRRHGDPNGRALGESLLERLNRKTEQAEDGCWQWRGLIDRHGYGSLSVGNRPRRAHRISYELHVGSIPDGLVIDHLCRNRACVNPAHLEPVTNSENIRRGETGQWRKAAQR